MSTGRHASDTASQHQPRTRQQPREMHDPALCPLKAAVTPANTCQMQQYADVSRWIRLRVPLFEVLQEFRVRGQRAQTQ